MRSLMILALAALTPAQLRAQCADGSTPPCQQGAPRVEKPRKALAMDPRGLAVLPFRVAMADTLMGEGFAELLAAELTQAHDLRPMGMATTLHAWRRAGGRHRAPLADPAAMQLARDVGAGLVAHGAIVAIGSRLTITAGLYNASTGRIVGEQVKASGVADSIDHLTRSIAADLLANAEKHYKAYYVFGHEKTLLDTGVIVHEGGANLLLARPGRTLQPAATLNPDLFTPIDQRAALVIVPPDTSRMYRIVSAQNLDAAEVARDGQWLKGPLRIVKPDAFWAASRFLILVQR